ncbi:hypothetical protein KP003_02985 [Geomonas nitrogeniifigens]|uniref:hypothetical protein n=1 Tax=Geomonas diazotrophica TaxID=2843197 RepID=UPI001C2CB0C8|nr:hypothetical protein [Geomonas nitrogeniifigens]QXE87390.1 hypothetical protein KP003_02985 [Geomonas nitrogeniifigens]
MSDTSSLGALAEKYSDLFRVAARRQRQKSYDIVYFGSLDAEWYRDPVDEKKNVLLSHQIAACSTAGVGANTIYFAREGARPDMKTIAEQLIRSVNGGEFPEDHHRKRTLICLSCHNTTAEGSILDDRDQQHIGDAIGLVHKLPVTLSHPVQVTLPGYSLVDIRLFDTMLLAPATHRSLKKLSSLLGSDGEMKLTISQRYLEDMRLLLQEDREGFVNYALKDTEATLKLFCLLQQSLNELAYKGRVRKLFITLANAAMSSFIHENEWHTKYLKKLNSARYTDARWLVKRAYYGGRNEGLLKGRTSFYEATHDKTWLDVDLTGCYPSVMSRVPRIDLDKAYELRLPNYHIDEERVAKLVADNVPLQMAKEARDALLVSREQFEATLRTMPKVAAQRIREGALVYDNTMINRWYNEWQRAKSNPDAERARVILPGFAQVQFHFKEKPPLYPCLHVHHCKYGLVYTLKGSTTATHMEIMLALDAGARVDAIWSLELPIERDEGGEPVLYMQDYLTRLATERKKFKDAYAAHKDPSDSVYEKLLKEFMNSLYGKFAQAVNPRKTCDISNFTMNRLEPSKVSDPVVAALTTGTARAVLSSLLLGVEHFNEGKSQPQRIDVASCTTDGLLVGVPSPKGYSVLQKYYELIDIRRDVEAKGKNYHVVRMRDKQEDMVDWSAPAVLNDQAFGAQGLLEILGTFLPIRLFRHARKELVKNAEYLEIKGMADDVVAVKSRGQIGIVTAETDDGPVECVSILAKFSVKPPVQDIEPDKEEFRFILDNEGVKKQVDGSYLLDHFMATEEGRDEIVTYTLYSLPSFGKIMKSNGTLDLVQLKAERKLNCDFDYKRQPLLRQESLYTGGYLYTPPYTLPFPSLSAMKGHRYQADNIRKAGRVARPNEVADRVRMRGRRSRSSKGEADRAVRMLLIAILQGILPTSCATGDYPGKVAILNEVWALLPKQLQQKRECWSVNDLKNFKRAEFECHCVSRYEALTNLVTVLCERFGVEPTAACSLIFDQEQLNLALIVEVVKAVLHGQYMEPFTTLSGMGLLPGRQDLLQHLSPPLTPEILIACEKASFVPGKRPTRDRDEIARLFRRIRIPPKYVTACASVLIEPPKEFERSQRAKVSNVVLESVTSCVLQPDFPTRPAHAWIISVLRPFGLSDEMFLDLKRQRFIPHRVTDTGRNRTEIMKLCQALRVDVSLVQTTVID